MLRDLRRHVRRATLAALLAQCLIALAPAAQAGAWEQILMPGPLIAGHAEFETECAKCHEQFDKGSQQRLCIACHEAIAADIESGMRFHGRSTAVKAHDCRHCHTDHKGREEDVVRLDPETFDHSLAGFALRGAHARLACRACHRPPQAFRDAPSQCVRCHESTDVHQGKLGPTCGDCHRETSWPDTTFDHGSTEFALHGKHAKVECLQCHGDRTFHGAASRCLSCHRLDDVHAGSYGQDCGTCHDSEAWTPVRFDHDRETRFTLRGRHAQIACAACHRPGADPASAGRECIACHRRDDAHRGRYGEDCARCHSQARWPDARFDHGRDSDFPLRGGHARPPCLACHKEPVPPGARSRQCIDCHAPDDVHRGELGRTCGDCHDAEDWSRPRFDHDLTRFPLIGLHALAPCEDCHRSSRFNEAPSACVDCHAVDDAHEERLGRDCARCHNPNGWALWMFDHDSQTDYPLDGSHRGIACTSCHRRPAGDGVDLARDCVACHAGQDVHDGRFGPVCERCHVTSSFKDLSMDGMRR